MNELLFSYGTLQKEKVQLDLFGRLLDGTKDALEGYKLSLTEIKDSSFLARGEEKYQQTLLPSGVPADMVEGTVLELSKEELSRADSYEPDNYKRIRIMLRSGREAWIYVAV